jgi:hypothetical protein
MSHPVQEEDRVASGKIVLTAIVSLAIFAVGIVWAVSIERNEYKNIGRTPAETGTTEAGKPEVGIVYQWPFYLAHYGNDKAIDKKELLESYGWVDKNAKVVHIPIEQAIERYVSQAGGAK